MKATSVFTLEFTFIGEMDPENFGLIAERSAEMFKEQTGADDVQLLCAKIFTHDANGEAGTYAEDSVSYPR